MPGQTINVVIVDDKPDLAAMLGAMLSLEPDICVVGTLADASGLVEIVSKLCPHVVLLDLTMPGKPPLEALRELSGATEHCEPATRVVVYSGNDDPAVVASAHDAGACGFLSKAADPSAVVSAVRAAFRPRA